jgi:phage tail-like protein
VPRPQDPYGNFRFLVEIDGITQASFKECSGLGASVDVIEYREGGDPTTVRRLPGLTRYHHIMLRWGLTDSHELYDWFREVTSGRLQRRNGTIVLLDADGAPKVRWNFVRGWPARWEGPDLEGDEAGVAIEALEIVHEGIERA